jgi:hypothetical protein
MHTYVFALHACVHSVAERLGDGILDDLAHSTHVRRIESVLSAELRRKRVR